jgi:hypothetical protein
MAEIDPIEELKAIEDLEKQDIQSTRWVIELVAFIIVISLCFILASCDNIQSRCLWADTNENCSLITI